MKWLDLGLVVLVAVDILLGYRTGFVRRILALAGTFIGVVVASGFGPALARQFASQTSVVDPVLSGLLIFLGLVALVVLAIEILAWMYAPAIRFLSVVAYDRAIGVATALAVALIQVGLVLAVLQHTAAIRVSGQPPPGAVVVQDMLDGSLLYPLLGGAVQVSDTVFHTVLPDSYQVWAPQS
ncbi:MAG: CvpA family protein [Candidatus Dormibacteria bacterium]